jgi:hypothetical protein
MQSPIAITSSIVCSLLAAGAACAQLIDDQANCAGLAQSGLYYFAFPKEGGAVISRIGSGAVQYQSNGRFYFVPPSRAQLATRGNEGVWHVRTETRAALAPKADAIYVYRAGVITRCLPTTTLSEYSQDERFVDINRYIDYHAPNNNGRDPNPGLYRNFHFQIQDTSTGSCIRTDDRSIYGDLAEVYGFPNISRAETVTALEGTTSVVSPVLAARVAYQGLSSEFVYRDGENTRCFSFTAPIPTGVHSGWFYSRYSAAQDAAQKWRPINTLIVIKRLLGRKVLEVVNRNVPWNN